MAEAQEKRPTTAHDVVLSLEDFILSNRHSRDEAMRWLATYAGEAFLPLMRQARSGGFDEASRTQIARFRLAEIEKEKADKQREIDNLDREARTLQAR